MAVDLLDFRSPSIITVQSHRPYLLISLNNYVLELSVASEPNSKNNINRKNEKYKALNDTPRNILILRKKNL